MNANAPTQSRPYIAFLRWTQKTVFELFMALEPGLKAAGAKNIAHANAEDGNMGLEFELNGLRLALTCEAPFSAGPGRTGDLGESILLKFRIQEKDGSHRLGWQEEIARFEIGFGTPGTESLFLDQAVAELAEKIRRAAGL